MLNSIPKVPPPHNEPVARLRPRIGGEEVAQARARDDGQDADRDPALRRRRAAQRRDARPTCARRTRTRRCSPRSRRPAPTTCESAIGAALAAQASWAATPLHERLAIFLRAAELLATKYRPILNAATMLGQSKTAHQAEIDAACESIDFLRFNVHFAERILAEQPLSAPADVEPAGLPPARRLRVRGDAVQLHVHRRSTCCTAPAMMGNAVLWKPASTAVLSAPGTSWSCCARRGCPTASSTSCPGTAPVHRQRGADAARTWAACTSPARRPCSRACGSTVGENIAALQAVPAAGGRDGRQGLHLRARLGGG